MLVQADNSWKESKNRCIFVTLAWFVYIGWFEEVELHCLIQGHTHEDIDQIFSTISRSFWITSILTLDAFQLLLKRIFSTRETNVPSFTSVWNFESFFSGLLYL